MKNNTIIGQNILGNCNLIPIDPYFRQGEMSPVRLFDFSPIQTGENPPIQIYRRLDYPA